MNKEEKQRWLFVTTLMVITFLFLTNLARSAPQESEARKGAYVNYQKCLQTIQQTAETEYFSNEDGTISKGSQANYHYQDLSHCDGALGDFAAIQKTN